MEATVQFRNLEGLNHIRSYLAESVTHTLGKFDKWGKFYARIILRKTHNRKGNHPPHFECELLINGKGIKRAIIVKKKSKDFYLAVRDCLSASEKILRRKSKIKSYLKRHRDDFRLVI